jgi:hypothetical protein
MLNMFENRKSPRFTSLAQARIAGLPEGEALIKDLSITGCRLEFSAAVAFEENKNYRIKVFPETNAKVEDFELEAQPRWSHAGYDSFEIGFAILHSPKGKAFQRYVDYLTFRLGSPR